MDSEITLQIVLEKPPAGVDFGLQKGAGNNYETVQKQRSNAQDLAFTFTVQVKPNKNSALDFYGPFVQGPPHERFIYIDIGTCAGQTDSCWTRRLKIPLSGISQHAIKQLMTDSHMILETHVPGTGKDGGPTCATVKPFSGWHLVKPFSGWHLVKH